MFISKRKHEPAHYMLKIESFSLLSEAATHKIESDVFEANGHKWRLDLYPNGNEEENNDEHISLYIVLCDTESCSKGWEVIVDVTFFVYDHLHHHYVTFQDVNGRRARFHEMKVTWGFDNLISLESFINSEYGYLSNDSCVFGVEVIAEPEFTKVDRCLQMMKPPTTMNNYTWTINNFSALTEKNLCSEVFKVGKIKYKLSLYPKGHRSGKGTHLSIYLRIHDDMLLPAGWKVYVKYKLRVKSHGGTECESEEELDSWFYNTVLGRGFPSFMLLTQLTEPKNGFLSNDNLVVEVEISVMGTLRHFI